MPSSSPNDRSTNPKDPGPPTPGDDSPSVEEAAAPGGLGMVIALITVSLVFSTCAAEGLLRLASDNPYANETTDYMMKIEAHHAFRDMQIDRTPVDPAHPKTRLRTSARSYVEPSAQFENPQATVAFFGGSTTQNVAVREELRFPALVSSLLAERGIEISTLNAGRSGISANDSVNLLFNHVIFDEPDVAVMMHAFNDIGVLAIHGEYKPRVAGNLDAGIASRWLFQTLSINSALFGSLRGWATASTAAAPGGLLREGKPADSKALPTEKFTNRLRAFVGLCRAFGITPVLMTQPVINVRTALTPDWSDPKNQEIFNHLIREVGESEKVLVIDLVQYLFDEVEDWNKPMVVFYDGVHATDYGSQKMAEHIADRLQSDVLPAILAKRETGTKQPAN